MGNRISTGSIATSAAAIAVAIVMAAGLALCAPGAAHAASPLAPGAAAGKTQVAAQAKKAKKVKIAKCRFAKIAKQKYTGKKVKPAVRVTYKGKRLKAGRDYAVSYKANVKPGTARAVVKGKGSYKGKKTLKFRIWSSKGRKWVVTSKKVKVGTESVMTGTEKVVKVTREAYDRVEPQVEDRRVRCYNNHRCWSYYPNAGTLYYTAEPQDNMAHGKSSSKNKFRYFDPPLQLPSYEETFVYDGVAYTQTNIPTVSRALDTLSPDVKTLSLPKFYKDLYSCDRWATLFLEAAALGYNSDKIVARHQSWLTAEQKKQFKEELDGIMDEVKLINTTSTSISNWEDRHEYVVIGPDRVVHHEAETETVEKPVYKTVNVYKTVKTGKWV